MPGTMSDDRHKAPARSTLSDLFKIFAISMFSQRTEQLDGLNVGQGGFFGLPGNFFNSSDILAARNLHWNNLWGKAIVSRGTVDLVWYVANTELQVRGLMAIERHLGATPRRTDTSENTKGNTRLLGQTVRNIVW